MRSIGSISRKNNGILMRLPCSYPPKLSDKSRVEEIDLFEAKSRKNCPSATNRVLVGLCTLPYARLKPYLSTQGSDLRNKGGRYSGINN